MSDGPKRIQLSRKKGWRMPENTMKVTRPGPWGNPHRIGDPGIPDAAAAVNAYRDGVSWGAFPMDNIEKLRGKNLACFCKIGEPCHADVLLELANREPSP